MKKPIAQSRTLRIWLAVWLIIYLLIIIVGLIAPQSDVLTVVKLGGIILCFVYALRQFPRDRMLQAAMFTTCIADLILAVNNTSEAGVIVFFITQIIHLVRLDGERLKDKLTVFAAIFAVVIIADLIFDFAPLIFVVSGFYAGAILTNINISRRWHQQEPNNFHATFAMYGFILFACCDFCTAISYFSLNAVLPAFFYGLANFMAWFFYYPSQVLVSNSSTNRRIKFKFEGAKWIIE